MQQGVKIQLAVILFLLIIFNSYSQNKSISPEVENQIQEEVKYYRKQGFSDEQLKEFYLYRKNTENGNFKLNGETFFENHPVHPFASCNNLDFETGDFSGWSGRTGCHPGANSMTSCKPLTGCCATAGFVNYRHTITNTSMGNDPICGFPMVAPGGSYSMQLGNSSAGAQAERIQQTFLVTKQNNLFTYQYAVVLQNPGHSDFEQPSFEAAFFDQNGDTIPCSYYYVAANADIPGFQIIPWDSLNPYTMYGQAVYKPWSTVIVNLENYIGQNVTARFTTMDCSQGLHYGYAYIDCSCNKFEIVPSDTIFCEGDPINVSLTAPSGATTYSWNTGDTTQTIQVTATGDYSVELGLVQSKVCKPLLKISLKGNPLPVASFKAPIVCLGSPTYFIDSSYVDTGTVVTWLWDFGNTQTSTQQNPGFSYSSYGSYTVSLTVTSDKGCQNKIVKTINVLAPVKPDFSANPVCLGTNIHFTDSSPAGVANWTWNFGDLSSSTLTHPDHTYSSAGTYTVSLIVSNLGGCTDSIQKTVDVYPIPLAGFTNNSVCLGQKTLFSDGSSVSSGSIASYQWSFGDTGSGSLNTSTDTSPSHQFTNAGTYTVSLITTSDKNCIDTIVKVLQVDPFPVPDFTGADKCLGQSIAFLNSTAGTGNNYSWSFGDGSNSTAVSPAHTYASSGIFDVSLLVVNSFGCDSVIKKQVEIFPLPVANFSSDKVCVGNTTSFSDSSNVASGSTVNSWVWDFGDGTAGSTGHNATHIYANAGTYTASLVITSSNGCKDSLTKQVQVGNPVVITPSANEVCLSQTNNFNVTVSSGNAASWSWNFGEAGSGTNTSTLQNPSHIYVASGTYTIHLSVLSADGCESKSTLTASVNPMPQADFSSGSVCLGSTTSFTDLSAVSSGNISTWLWNFGEAGSTANSSSINSPSHNYTSSGNYQVSLVVTSNKGCIDTIIKPIDVSPVPVPNFSGMDVCLNEKTLFTDSSVIANGGTIKAWLWNFGDGTNSNLTSPIHTYQAAGIYTVTLTVSSGSCTKSMSLSVQVYPFPIANFGFSPNPASTYDPVVTFTDLSVDAATGSWDFSDATSAVYSGGSIVHTYSTESTGGSYDVTLFIQNKYGCPDQITKTVEIQPDWAFYIPNTFTPNGNGVNDMFTGKGFNILEYEMWIYDRWGNEIYHCNNINEGWDGKVEGGKSNEQSQIDTYVWVVKLKDVFSKQHRYIGHVNIIK